MAFDEKLNQGLPVSLSLMFGKDGDVLDLENAVALVGDDALGLCAMIEKHVHRPSFEISVDHVFLLVRQKQQRKIALLVFTNFYDFHDWRTVMDPSITMIEH